MPEIEPVALAGLTTLRVGGVPERLIEATTRDELIDALRDAWASGQPWLVLGGGSNLLVGDEAFEGTVVLVRTSGIRRLPSPREGYVRLQVEAGHNWDDLVAYAAAEGLSGIVAMSGIPGTVGAAPVQNIGAYGQELVETLVEAELIDEATGDVSTVAAAELELGFRTSVLKNHYGSVAARSAVILSVTPGRSCGRRSASPRVSPSRSRGCARPCSRRVPARGWCSMTATPTRTVRGRSSRTRSSRHPSPVRCLPSARAGRWPWPSTSCA